MEEEKKLLKSLLITKPVFLQIMTVLLPGIHYCAAELVSERMFYLTFFPLTGQVTFQRC